MWVRKSALLYLFLVVSVSTHSDTHPERLGIGSPADPVLIAAWDTAVTPDGKGLPAGNGCVPEGKKVYLEQCQLCHGVKGKGGQYDELAGRFPDNIFPFATEPGHARTIGNYWPWATTLFDYIRRSMPLLTPGSLNDNEVYSLCAYLLHLNELLPPDGCINAQSLPAIDMPGRKHFIVDNRLETPSVR